MNHHLGCCQEKVATGMTARVRCAEVRSIRMDVEDHVRSAVANFGIRMRGHVVKEMVDTIQCLFSGCALLGGDGKQHHKDCRIDSISGK